MVELPALQRIRTLCRPRGRETRVSKSMGISLEFAPLHRYMFCRQIHGHNRLAQVICASAEKQLQASVLRTGIFGIARTDRQSRDHVFGSVRGRRVSLPLDVKAFCL